MMYDIQIIGLLLISLCIHFSATLIPIGLATAALASAAYLNFEPVAV